MAHRHVLGLALLLCALVGPAAPAAAQNVAFTTQVQVRSIEATEDVAFSGVVATFEHTDQSPSNFTATIHWGDGSSSPGTVGCCATTSPRHTVSGTHTWTEPGTYTVRVVV